MTEERYQEIDSAQLEKEVYAVLHEFPVIDEEAMKRIQDAVQCIAEAWRAVTEEMWKGMAGVFGELLKIQEQIKEEDHAVRWAEIERRDLARRYHHTKKRRTRKKYRKRIVEAYLKEVSGTVSEYTCGKPEYAMYQDGDYCPMETGEVEGCADCCYGVEKKEEAGE